MWSKWFSKDTKNEEQASIRQEALLYVEPLYRAALTLTRNEAEAEDLVQDTFLRAFRFEDRYEPGTHLRAWLFKIQFNIFVNRYRRRQREEFHIKESISLESEETGASSPETQYLQQTWSKEVSHALNMLSEEYRSVVMLSDVHEFTYKEIADIMTVPVGTVMSRLYRGRQMLRQSLLKQQKKTTTSVVEDTDAVITDLDAYRLKQFKDSHAPISKKRGAP